MTKPSRQHTQPEWEPLRAVRHFTLENAAGTSTAAAIDAINGRAHAQPTAEISREGVLTRSMPRGGRPEAAEAIWSWRDHRASATTGAAPSRARLYGVFRALVGSAIGALLWTTGARAVATVALCISAITLLLALVMPARVERWTTLLGRGIGTLITWVLMTVIFYGFFLPFRMLVRRGRRDAMKRYFDRDAPTYWKKRPDEPPRYERLF
jgi:hypothetical protein